MAIHNRSNLLELILRNLNSLINSRNRESKCQKSQINRYNPTIHNFLKYRILTLDDAHQIGQSKRLYIRWRPLLNLFDWNIGRQFASK